MRKKLIVLAALALVGCVTKDAGTEVMTELALASRRDPEAMIRAVDAVAANVGSYTRNEIRAGDFILVVRMSSFAPAGADLEIAINGDAPTGAMLDQFGNEFQITPAQSFVASQLDFMDRLVPQRDVVFIERPCYAVTPRIDPKCKSDYWWGRGRYSEPVIAAMNEAVDWVKQKRGASRINLIGESAGGALAVLIAARRSDVAGVVTLSAALDLELISRHQAKIASLNGAEEMYRNAVSPLAQASRIRNVPQLHMRGSNDQFIPVENWSNYLSAAGSPNCITVQVFAGGHADQPAAELWRRGVSPPLKKCK